MQGNQLRYLEIALIHASEFIDTTSDSWVEFQAAAHVFPTLSRELRVVCLHERSLSTLCEQGTRKEHDTVHNVDGVEGYMVVSVWRSQL
eukprot:4369002-Amphidinium_carterae.1